jgi:hypothetical protein
MPVKIENESHSITKVVPITSEAAVAEN